MPRLHVESSVAVAAAPDVVWGHLRDFCAAWHPAVDHMETEKLADGSLIRRFTVKGERTAYRERLTYFSDSQRVMAYTHVEGIEKVESYDAQLKVSAHGDGAHVTMSADITASEPRASEIAEGTQAVFDLGAKTIALMPLATVSDDLSRVASEHVPVEKVVVEGTPALALDIVGQPSDTLCLFLHGIGGNKSNWAKQLSAVAPLCRAAALDLRGYGESALGPAQSTVDDYCDDILRAMKATGCKRLILCGLSYGAWIATSFAMRHPEKLQALVLAGGCTGMSEAEHGERAAFRKSREAPMQEGKTPANFAPAVVDVIAGPEATAPDRAELLASMAAIPTETYADALRCFTNPPETFDFARLNLPVLMMTGENDRLAPPSEISAVADRIWNSAAVSDVRFEIIAGAGHVCNLEKADAFNQILVEFLQRVRA